MSIKDKPGRGEQPRPRPRPEGQPRSRQERRRQERRREVVRQQPGVSSRRWWLIGGVTVVLLAAIGGGSYFAFAGRNQNNSSNMQAGAPIDGIECGAMEGQAEHIHSHVALFRNGKPVTIPAYVGIPINQNIPASTSNYCYYWLHTHATTDVVHIEAPASGTYKLGQFVDIWRYTALWDSQSTIANTPTVDGSFANALLKARPSQVHVYVGAKEVNTPWRDLTFADHKNMTVELGTPLKPPVATFDWKHWNGS